MTATRTILRWTATSASVRGSSHRRSDTVNQDAVGVREVTDGLVVAVGDGHGSKTHVRSDAGSRLAVEVAGDIGAELIAGGALRRPDGRLARQLQGEVAADLVERWRAAVLADVQANPWTADELAVSPGVPGDPYHGYGTTIMVALAGPDGVAVLQLGDGDVLVGHRSGRVQLPVPGDDRLIGNQTTSLCLESAPDDFRATIVALDDDPIRFVSITTDGYANSFASESWGDEVGADLIEHLDGQGLSYVAANLDEWLGESAEIGGDDVTMGLVVAELETVDVSDDDLEGDDPPDGPARDLLDLDEVSTQVKGRPRRRRVLLVLLIVFLVLAATGGGVAALLLL